MRGEGGAATGAVGDYFEALIKKPFVPDFLKSPPFRLYKVVGIGNVGVVHISPEADGCGEILPHFLIIPNRFLTVRDKRGKTVAFNLVLSVNAEFLLYLKLNGKTVSIPTRLTNYSFSFHGLIAGNHVFYYTGKHVPDMGLTVCRGGTVVEGEVIAL